MIPMQDPNSVRLLTSRRKTRRHDYRVPFELRYDDRALIVDGLNISRSGIAGIVRGIVPLAERTRVRVHLHHYRPIEGTVRWTRGREVGISFIEDLANHPRLHALVARVENGQPALPAGST